MLDVMTTNLVFLGLPSLPSILLYQLLPLLLSLLSLLCHLYLLLLHRSHLYPIVQSLLSLPSSLLNHELPTMILPQLIHYGQINNQYNIQRQEKN